MKTEIKWGLIFSLMMLLWLALERLTGLHDKHIGLQAYLTNLIAIPAIWIYVLMLREKRRQLGGKLSFKQAFLAGLLMTVVAAVLVPPSQWLTFNFITPHYLENALNYSVAHGQPLAEAQAFFNRSNYLRVGIIGALGMGLITTLILAFIMRTQGAPAASQAARA